MDNVELVGAAQMGDPNAQFQLGMSMIQGKTIPVDIQQGIRWMLESVNQTEDVKVMFFLTATLNNVTSETDKKWILEELQERTRIGECIAPYLLGIFFENSKFVPTDYEQSVDYYMCSASRGCSLAMDKLGAYHTQIMKDLKEGMFWYFKAAEISSSAAWYAAGLNVFDNEDVAAVVGILMYCAEKDVVIAQYLLARRYESGNGIEKDGLRAKYWLDKVTEHGYRLEDINVVIQENMYKIWGKYPNY